MGGAAVTLKPRSIGWSWLVWIRQLLSRRAEGFGGMRTLNQVSDAEIEKRRAVERGDGTLFHDSRRAGTYYAPTRDTLAQAEREGVNPRKLEREKRLKWWYQRMLQTPVLSEKPRRKK